MDPQQQIIEQILEQQRPEGSPGPYLFREERHPNILNIREKDDHVEIRVENFDSASATHFDNAMAKVLRTRQTYVIIRIDSYGGEVDALRRMLSCIDTVKAQGIVVVTECSSKAMSCGAVLLAMGTPGYRYCSRHVEILIHQISGGTSGTKAEMENQIKEFTNNNAWLFRVMAQNAGLEDESFYANLVKKYNNDIYIHAATAVKLRLVDHIGTPMVTKTVDVVYSVDTPNELSEAEIEALAGKEIDDVMDLKNPLAEVLRPRVLPPTASSPRVLKPSSPPALESVVKGTGKQPAARQQAESNASSTAPPIAQNPTNAYGTSAWPNGSPGFARPKLKGNAVPKGILY